MTIATESISSIPWTRRLIEAIAAVGDGCNPALGPPYDEAIRDTIEGLDATGPRKAGMMSLSQPTTSHLKSLERCPSRRIAISRSVAELADDRDWASDTGLLGYGLSFADDDPAGARLRPHLAAARS